jgi:hypothetical protein
LTSDSYRRVSRSTGSTREGRADRGGRVRPIGPGFAVVMIFSIFSTVVLLVLALAYYSGSPGRVASDYTSIAFPANRALSVERADYARDREHHLAAAKSDLLQEAKTVASFDNQLAGVSFPSAAATAADALTRADQKLAKLIGLQAQARRLRRMRSFDPSVAVAAAAVQTQVGRLRHALGLPPPASGTLF